MGSELIMNYIIVLQTAYVNNKCYLIYQLSGYISGINIALQHLPEIFPISS